MSVLIASVPLNAYVTLGLYSAIGVLFKTTCPPVVFVVCCALNSAMMKSSTDFVVIVVST